MEVVLTSEASLMPRSLVVELEAEISNPVRTPKVETGPAVKTVEAGSRKLLDQV